MGLCIPDEGDFVGLPTVLMRFSVEEEGMYPVKLRIGCAGVVSDAISALVLFMVLTNILQPNTAKPIDTADTTLRFVRGCSLTSKEVVGNDDIVDKYFQFNNGNKKMNGMGLLIDGKVVVYFFPFFNFSFSVRQNCHLAAKCIGAPNS